MEEKTNKMDTILASLSNLDKRITDSFKKIEAISKHDPSLTCSVGRKFLEYIIDYLDKSADKTNALERETLHNRVLRLEKCGVLPRLPARWAHTLKALGNVGSHAQEPGQEATFDDADEVLDAATKLAQWFESTLPAAQRAKKSDQSSSDTQAPGVEVEGLGFADKDSPESLGLDSGAAVIHEDSVVTTSVVPEPEVAAPTTEPKNGWGEAHNISDYYRVIIFCRHWGKVYFLLSKDQKGIIRSIWLQKTLPPTEKIGKILTNGMDLNIDRIWRLGEDQYLTVVKQKKHVVYGGLTKLFWLSTDEMRGEQFYQSSEDRDIISNALRMIELSPRAGMPIGGQAVKRSEFVWRG